MIIWLAFQMYKYLHEYCLGKFHKVVDFDLVEKGEVDRGKMRPLDYETLKKDQKFLSILKTLQSQNEVEIYFLDEIYLSSIEFVIQNIEKQWIVILI